MSRRRRIFIATHIAAAITGMVVGLWYTKSILTRIDDQITGMMLSDRYAQLPELQRAMGGPNEYRDALLSNVARFDEDTRHLRDPRFRDICLYDKALTYVRLARVERGAGNPGAAEKYLSQAASFCVRISWKDCTPERLVEVSERLEQSSLLGGKDEKAAEDPNQPGPLDGGHEALRHD